ncbi:MAG: hypothetical protein JNM69_20530 [Archangium sp.]|nr:hypothetical protein [Archangium sp.]
MRFIQSKVKVDRLEAVVEAHVMSAAKVRERCGIPGTSVRSTFLCRDKPAMKEALRQAGVACAQLQRLVELRRLAELPRPADVQWRVEQRPADPRWTAASTSAARSSAHST